VIDEVYSKGASKRKWECVNLKTGHRGVLSDREALSEYFSKLRKSIKRPTFTKKNYKEGLLAGVLWLGVTFQQLKSVEEDLGGEGPVHKILHCGGQVAEDKGRKGVGRNDHD